MNIPGCNPIWSWTFGDGSGTSSQQHPSYQYDKSGTYEVTLAASNAGGTSTKKLTINVTNN
jgi:PKD repeat protein